MPLAGQLVRAVVSAAIVLAGLWLLAPSRARYWARQWADGRPGGRFEGMDEVQIAAHLTHRIRWLSAAFAAIVFLLVLILGQ